MSPIMKHEATPNPFAWLIRATDRNLDGIDVYGALIAIGKSWRKQERKFECSAKKPFTYRMKDEGISWNEPYRIPCQDHVRYVRDPRDVKLCMCVIEPYRQNMDCIEELINFCKEHGLTFTIDGESSHFPGACIRIVIRKKEVQNMAEDIDEMKRELTHLIRIRKGAVGIDLKRVNYQIAELQNQIDHADMMEQIEEGKKDDVKIFDFEELAEELEI